MRAACKHPKVFVKKLLLVAFKETPKLRQEAAIRLLRKKLEHLLKVGGLAWESVLPALHTLSTENILFGLKKPAKFMNNHLVPALEQDLVKKLQISQLGNKLTRKLKKLGLDWHVVLPRLLVALELQSAKEISRGAQSKNVIAYFNGLIADSIDAQVIERSIQTTMSPNVQKYRRRSILGGEDAGKRHNLVTLSAQASAIMV